jgi:uncharacterized membrane protein YdjX (TVP38/TMEM64 family)
VEQGAPVKRYLPLLIIVLALAAVLLSGGTRYLTLEALQENDSALRAFVSHQRLPALLLFAGLYAFVTAISIPGALVLTLAGGYLFGPWLGGAATVVGATIGATAVFFAVRTSFGENLRRRADSSGGRLKAIVEGVAAGAFGYILTLRLIPLVPFWLVNVAAGIAHAPPGAYVLATFIGIMPATFIYSGIGSGIGSLVQRGERIDAAAFASPQILLPLAGLALLSLGATIYRQRRRPAVAQP